MERKDILAEIEDVIRSMPPRATIRHETSENHNWFGRAAAVLHCWNPTMCEVVRDHIDAVFDVMAKPAERGLRNLIVLLERARTELRMETVGPVSVVIGHSQVFDYFDEVRKVIGLASLTYFSSIHIWMLISSRAICLMLQPACG